MDCQSEAVIASGIAFSKFDAKLGKLWEALQVAPSGQSVGTSLVGRRVGA
jgi:hypothetical protein